MSIKSKIKSLLSQPKGESGSLNKDFKTGMNDSILTRNYDSYRSYLEHQSEKLSKQIDQIREYDIEYENVVFERYNNNLDLYEKSIICLAARLGGEVRAFKRMGALAIGIDIEPGENNLHVLHGDFHDLQFADNSFDFAFTNAIDHVYDLERYLVEINRILKERGCFIIEFAEVNPGNYEVIDTRDVNPILNFLKKYFVVSEISDLVNAVGFANWSGKLIKAQKLKI